MTSSENKHQKHSKLNKPSYGEYHRNEFAFVGAPCGDIQSMVSRISVHMSQKRLAYIDADHKSADEASNPDYNTWSSLTDKITFRSFQSFSEYNKFDHQYLFNDHDLVLVNGNHFRAEQQIIIVHPKKLDSLQRKLERLTKVRMILLSEGVEEVPNFLKNFLGTALNEIPVHHTKDERSVIQLFQDQLAPPRLKGLILAGGKSSRMGSDKTIMEFYGKPQREHLKGLLNEVCEEVYISCRPDQESEFSTSKIITDKFVGLGPYGAIMSAFQEDPNAAWLVIASDLPLMDVDALQELVNARNASRVATCFRSPVFGLPEPLVTIWEPKSYFHLLQFLGLGYSCPRKVLINTNTKVFDAERPEVLMNMNTPDDLKKIRKMIGELH